MNWFEKRPSTWVLAVVAVLALALNLLATGWLNESYAQSQFPVPYHVAQLSFDAQQIKGWYAFLIERGTLDVYRVTQHIDFAFIATVLVLHACVLLLVSRVFAAGSRGRSIMVWAAALSTLAPLADALENLVSYVMLADPLGFPDGLAMLYSSLAALKFGMFTFAYLVAPMGLVVGLVMRLKGRSVRSTQLKASEG